MTKTFAAQVEDQVAQIDEMLTAVFKLAVQTTVSQMLEPGPSVASTTKAIAKGIGSRGRGKNRRSLAGPVPITGGLGHLPIDTGYLRASFQLSEGEPTVRAMPPRVDGKTYDLEPYEAIITGSNGEKPLYASFSAAYAAAVEFGLNGAPARAFIRTAVQRWQSNVDSAVAEVKGKFRG